MKKSKLPKRVYAKNGAYWHVRADGKKRVWTRLSAIADGLPGMYRALADLEQADLRTDTVPQLVDNWRLEVSAKHKPKAQANDLYQTEKIKQAFAEFRSSEVQPPEVAEFLKQFRKMPRTFNAYHSMLRELMRYAEEKGFRPAGSNPVPSVKRMKTKVRSRYITDSELRRIKVGICYGEDGKRTPTGPMICCLIEMAYLTGQRANDLRRMEWTEIGQRGIMFQPGKTLESTAVAILVRWTDRLRKLVERLRQFTQPGKHVFRKLDGSRYTYSGVNSAWKRGLARAGIPDTQFRDLRAKALTDLDDSHGIKEAQRLGGHSTQDQTADYVRHKRAVQARAAR